MIGRIYTLLFILTIIISLWYQRVYLNKSAVEFNAQLMAENSVLPTVTAIKYNSFNYENGILKSNFSGDKGIYFSNKHFQAKENLVYKELNLWGKTDYMQGEVESLGPETSKTIMSKNKLKYIVLPHRVDFNYNNNVGVTSYVYVDAIKKTIQSERAIESHGPGGYIRGIGFNYSMLSENFVLESNVEGMIIPSIVQKN